MAITKNKTQIKELVLEKELRSERTYAPWGSYIYGWDYYEDDYYTYGGRYDEWCTDSKHCNCSYCTNVELETVYKTDIFGNEKRYVIPGGKLYRRNHKIDILLSNDEISNPISDIHYKLRSVGLAA
jgi:hypothetical protein